jgi:cystathionine beta-synthase
MGRRGPPRSAAAGDRDVPNETTSASVLDCIGNTPLARLTRMFPGHSAEVYAKLEFMNPSGSVKDRLARFMIDEAEKDGRLKPGDLIIENSSGNTAMALAMVAIQRGYRLKVVVRDRSSREKLEQLRAMGVDVLVVDSTLPPEHPDSYNRITPRLAAETPNCYFPDQHGNRENNEAHYRSTGPEIWQQMEGRIDFLVAGVGTGGTLGGAARFLKEQDPRVRVVAVDGEGSVFTEYFRSGRRVASRDYLVEGIGDEQILVTMDFHLIDEMIQVRDRDAFQAARELACTEGILAGVSSGAVIAAIRELLTRVGGAARIATIFPDGASRYLTKMFNQEWLSEHHLL